MDLDRFDRNELKNQFINSEPFHHIVIDNFLDDNFLNDVTNEIKNMPESKWYDEQFKHINNERDSVAQSKKIALTDVKKMEPLSQKVMEMFHSTIFLNFLEDVTDIKELQNDPYQYGAGIHRIKRDGHLAIHADFNIHPMTQKYRRINALLYLNQDWKEEYNGQLELWNKDMSKCVHSIPPIFNRLVIFRITDDAYHGHPDPWKAPEGKDRFSFAFYYYTDDRPEHEKSAPHMALWKRRYGTHF
jgi:Rps23 Pro-64 3,4-dihydroxylase Tpa1-like proline 4-hydroxylase